MIIKIVIFMTRNYLRMKLINCPGIGRKLTLIYSCPLQGYRSRNEYGEFEDVINSPVVVVKLFLSLCFAFMFCPYHSVFQIERCGRLVRGNGDRRSSAG